MLLQLITTERLIVSVSAQYERMALQYYGELLNCGLMIVGLEDLE